MSSKIINISGVIIKHPTVNPIVLTALALCILFEIRMNIAQYN